MANEYYYRRGSTVYGPVGADQLRALAAAGKLEPGDAIRAKDQSQWYEAGKVRGLFDAPSPRPAASAQSGPGDGSDTETELPSGAKPTAEAAARGTVYRVECADRATGEIQQRLFEAGDEADAARQAAEQGFLVGKSEVVGVPGLIRTGHVAQEGEMDRPTLGIWVGLLVAMGSAAISALMPWINIFAGGLSGIEGDGKIVLSVSAAVGIVLGLAWWRRDWLAATASAALAWGVVLSVWMGRLIYEVAVIFRDPEMAENPFAAAFATQVTPGAGLYLGLVSATAAMVLGFLLAWRTDQHAPSAGVGRWRWPGTGAAVGVVLAFLLSLVHLGLGADDAEPFGGLPREASSSEAADSPFDFGRRDAPRRSDTTASDEQSSEEGSTSPGHAASPEPDAVPVELIPTVLDKRHDDSGTESFIWMDVEWDASELGRPVEAVKGLLRVKDPFDDTQVRVGWRFTERIEPGDRFTQEGVGFSYNRFNHGHQWVRTTQIDNMDLVFEPEAVIFADGDAAGLRQEPDNADLLRPTVTGKRTSDSDLDKYVWFDIEWDTSNLPQPTRAIRGTVVIADVFGDPELRIGWTIDDPLEPGEPFREEGVGFRYNRFTSSHRWVRDTDIVDMRFYFVPDSVVYDDGSREDF